MGIELNRRTVRKTVQPLANLTFFPKVGDIFAGDGVGGDTMKFGVGDVDVI